VAKKVVLDSLSTLTNAFDIRASLYLKAKEKTKQINELLASDYDKPGLVAPHPLFLLKDMFQLKDGEYQVDKNRWSATLPDGRTIKGRDHLWEDRVARANGLGLAELGSHLLGYPPDQANLALPELPIWKHKEALPALLNLRDYVRAPLPTPPAPDRQSWLWAMPKLVRETYVNSRILDFLHQKGHIYADGQARVIFPCHKRKGYLAWDPRADQTIALGPGIGTNLETPDESKPCSHALAGLSLAGPVPATLQPECASSFLAMLPTPDIPPGEPQEPVSKGLADLDRDTFNEKMGSWLDTIDYQRLGIKRRTFIDSQYEPLNERNDILGPSKEEVKEAFRNLFFPRGYTVSLGHGKHFYSKDFFEDNGAKFFKGHFILYGRSQNVLFTENPLDALSIKALIQDQTVVSSQVSVIDKDFAEILENKYLISFGKSMLARQLADSFQSLSGSESSNNAQRPFFKTVELLKNVSWREALRASLKKNQNRLYPMGNLTNQEIADLILVEMTGLDTKAILDTSALEPFIPRRRRFGSGNNAGRKRALKLAAMALEKRGNAFPVGVSWQIPMTHDEIRAYLEMKISEQIEERLAEEKRQATKNCSSLALETSASPDPDNSSSPKLEAPDRPNPESPLAPEPKAPQSQVAESPLGPGPAITGTKTEESSIRLMAENKVNPWLNYYSMPEAEKLARESLALIFQSRIEKKLRQEPLNLASLETGIPAEPNPGKPSKLEAEPFLANCYEKSLREKIKAGFKPNVTGNNRKRPNKTAKPESAGGIIPNDDIPFRPKK
jgi:hypothetical protein